MASGTVTLTAGATAGWTETGRGHEPVEHWPSRPTRMMLIMEKVSRFPGFSLFLALPTRWLEVGPHPLQGTCKPHGCICTLLVLRCPTPWRSSRLAFDRPHSSWRFESFASAPSGTHKLDSAHACPCETSSSPFPSCEASKHPLPYRQTGISFISVLSY